MRVSSLRQNLLTPTGVSALLAIGAFVYGITTLKWHGITFDEPALFYAGDRTLFWLTHPTLPGALDLKGSEPPGFKTEFVRFPNHTDPQHYPVFPSLVAAVVSWLFHGKLHWLDAIDGHHLGLLLLNAVALFFYGRYSCRLLGYAAGIASTLALALFPCALGHSFNNAKDWPSAQLSGISLLCFGVGILQGRPRQILIASCWWGLALSSKMNAAFVAIPAVLFTPVAYFEVYRHRRAIPARLIGALALVPIIASVLFFVCWPWLYQGSVSEWWSHLKEYFSFMLAFGVGNRTGWTPYPVKCVLFMTPPVVLGAALYFLLLGWRTRQVSQWVLVALWFGTPILRAALPRSSFYDANRHFIEYIPALCALAGAGLAQILSELKSHARAWIPARVIDWSVAVAGLISVVLPVVEYAPYENTYFNFMIGGLGGAQQTGLFAMPPTTHYMASGTEGDYWFGASRSGLLQAYRLAGPHSVVGVCGPPKDLARANAGALPIQLVETGEPEFWRADVLYISPRENFCSWERVRGLESQRPVLSRVERGGGLIYELLGPKGSERLTPISMESCYARPDHCLGR